MPGLTIDNPTELQYVVNSLHILPGDVIKLRAGTYKGNWVINVGGSEAAPITFMPYNNEKVVIDGSWTVARAHVTTADLEIMDSSLDRTTNTQGIYAYLPGFRMHGCLIHDLHLYGTRMIGSGSGHICECVYLNNGWTSGGHGIYTYSETGDRLIARNVFFNNLGEYLLHVYSSNTDHLLKGYTIEDNILRGDPIHTGGAGGLIDYIYQRNIQYMDACYQGRYSLTAPNTNGQIINNVFFDVWRYWVNTTCISDWVNLTESGNLVYGGEPSDRAGYTLLEQPATWTKVIPFSLSLRWKASVAIFNRDSAETVAVDFTGVLAEGSYLLRNTTNYTETWAFDYTTGSVNVPMTIWTAIHPIGMTGDLHESFYPIFGAFVVEVA